MSIDESPANIENQVFIDTDFKRNPVERLEKFGNFTCRFKSEDGRVAYTKAHIGRYPITINSQAGNGKANNVHCPTPKWDL